MIKTGMIVDVINRKIFPGELQIEDGKIIAIKETPTKTYSHYILPGFIDSHIHIESSMLIPSEFARVAVRHGLVSTVSDPHEIANVLGVSGVDYMIKNGQQTPFKFYFGAPSCVPATSFETAGACIDSNDINELLSRDDIVYLSEMMNYPGVIHNDPDVMRKIAIATEFGKPIDGHAPGLRGNDLKHYVSSGISTDHECFSLEEALEKIALGMKIIIREGSAARNFEALHPLISEYSDVCMFCSDDCHPDQLIKQSINHIVKKSVQMGYPLFEVLKIASVNPVKHYGLQVGLLQQGDAADFIVVESLSTFKILETVIDGHSVFSNNTVHIPSVPADTPNKFNAVPIKEKDIHVPLSGKQIRTIDVIDGQLITQEGVSNHIGIESDVLKIVVVNRYTPAKPAIAFVKNMGLKKGAIASSVAHDSHNIVAVGASDEELTSVINAIIHNKGGLSLIDDTGTLHSLPLPVAGLMSTEPIEEISKKYGTLDMMAKKLGSTLNAPYMTLSFLALLVIPKLKLSDLGLFDGESFKFTSYIID